MRLFRFSAVIFLFLAGCKVGPDYYPPTVEMPQEYREDKQDETFYIDDEDLVEWWSRFDDSFLDYLIETAIAQNYNYRIAIEKVFQARSQYWVQFTQILPEFDADALATRYRVSRSFASQAATGATPTAAAASVSPIDNFYQIGLDAIWEIDIWGKYRRAAEAAFDIWEATDEERWGVKLTVISEVANTYAAICSYQQLQDIAKQVVDLDKEILSLADSRFEAGLSDEQEVDAAQATLEADNAQLTIVQAALKQYIYALAILVGELPESFINNFLVERAVPSAEGKVPIDIPSQLLRRRPDIRAAERQLAAATEQIGVAVADLFPSLSLTGSSAAFAANPLQGANVGYSSDRLNRLFDPKSLIWGIGGLVTQPVFDFGKRSAAVEVQVALQRQACYNYQYIVLAAIVETETALEVFFNEEIRQKDLVKQVQANFRILELTADLYQAGLADYSQVIQTKEIWLASVNTLIQSKQALAIDLIAIYKALGGHW